MALSRGGMTWANQFNRPDQTFSSTGDSMDFGFTAQAIRIANGSAKSVYVTFHSSVASTNDFEVRSSETLQTDNVYTNGLGFCATSSGVGVRITAWG
jgi:hypothetical protein